MLYLSQQDARWSKITLGKTPFTVGRWGCTITCISMALDYYKKYKDPKTLAKTLTFTDGGLLVWSSLGKVGIKLKERFYGYNVPKIYDAVYGSSKTVCLLQVNNNHWVIALGRSVWGGWRIADPWTGKLSTTRAYRDNVTGGAIITI